MKKRFITAIIFFLLISSGFYFYLYPRLIIINGYVAKIACSCYFVSHLPEKRITEEELGYFPVSLSRFKIDETTKSVTATFGGFRKQTAVFTPGYGCTLLPENNASSSVLPFQRPTDPERFDPFSTSFRDSLENFAPQKIARIDSLVAEGFEENLKKGKKNTRAIVVLHRGTLLAEKYGNGADAHTPLLGWSMTKTIMGILAGIMAKEGKWQLSDQPLFQNWSDDSKKDITLRDLLQMRSGLRWEEKYSDLSEATIMLYDQPNMGLYASEQPLQDSTPFWYYSSGTSNILSFLMAQKFDTHQEYLNYPYEQLFKPLGISDFTLETDSEGYYVMSSYGYGTARDWSKLGQLILQRGVWQRDTLYHTSWADFMATPAEGSNGDYGGHIWLNQGKKSPELSTGSLFMQGYQGQYVYIIPELDLVVVRLGNTYTSSSLDLDEWIITLAETIKEITESSSHQQ